MYYFPLKSIAINVLVCYSNTINRGTEIHSQSVDT
uniref:Uncharacterized protein n=1 Tax=Siphoviridae sp. ctqPo10 TaxID=2827948 RepID=A0A8S5SUB8_9CAUD|nr:MAG TPA: hypothetical protein [Siphoviridae sp. ctqPo10]